MVMVLPVGVPLLAEQRANWLVQILKSDACAGVKMLVRMMAEAIVMESLRIFFSPDLRFPFRNPTIGNAELALSLEKLKSGIVFGGLDSLMEVV
jgi:hypothetical protein